MTNNLYDYGITFNGRHSSEFGLDIAEGKQIGFPGKTKVLVPLPYTNQIIDFSEIYGEQTYTERLFKIPFHVIDRSHMDKESMYVMWTKVVDWLMEPSGKVRLYDDIMKEYYYLAEVQQAPDFDEFRRRGILTIEFQCYPFRISELAEGNDIWDSFNFELDIAQLTTYSVDGKKDIVLYNNGIASAKVTIICSNDLELRDQNNNKYLLKSGENKFVDLMIKKGENILTVIGKGTIEFVFHKEII